ncbi:MAG: tetratricopeptide repeat protein [Pirellulales bacterium]|nr:tetratricopeptide repeat protein [Pirellulales bacterium]
MRSKATTPTADQQSSAVISVLTVLIRFALVIATFVAVAGDGGDASVRSQDRLAEARSLRLRGRYAEATERYQELARLHPVESVLGLAACSSEQGRRANAVQVLSNFASADKVDARVWAALAELSFSAGDYDQAQDYLVNALEIDSNCLLARWIDAELMRTAGDLDKANSAYKWFVTYYNAHREQIRSPEDLHLIGRAAANFARWNRLHDQFGFLVNTLYPDAVALDADYWPAHLARAEMFAEKFNTAEAQKALAVALQINPNAPEALAAKASLAIKTFDFETALPALKRALEINPELVEGHRLMADIQLANFHVQEAIDSLEVAQRLNPNAEATLGRMAAIYSVSRGIDVELARAKHEGIIDKVTAANPAAGEFYFVLAQTLADFRRWPQAGEAFRKASSVMPQLVGPKAALGMMHMRLGQEEQARAELEAAFEEDPFNIRVQNVLEVLDVLDSYATLETDHFTLKFDPEHDSVFAKYLSSFMEEIYPELCEDFAFHPPERSLFEVFNRSKSTSGHGWFSSRMVGLPYIGTVGGCAGQMVAITSPDAMNTKFNWARVVRHEFVHVINLQQTNFNVPHWFTEGLAVEAEGYPRPELWDRLLASRVPTGDVFNLDDINFGFIRPASQSEWHLAYCQAELYVQFMREEFSQEGPAKMLRAYADNLTTQQAIEVCFGVPQAEFENRYRDYLSELVASLPPGLGLARKQRSLAEIDRAARANPNDPDALADLAEAYLLREEYTNARKFAKAAADIQDKHQQAAYVLARLQLVTGEQDQAMALLDAAINPQEPFAPGIQLLSALKCAQGDFAEAEELVLTAKRAQPNARQWTEYLAAIYLRSGDDEKLAPQLEILANADADQFNYRKKLAVIAASQEDYSAAARWAREGIWIDVNDVDLHEILANASRKLDDARTATDEYRTLQLLQPDIERWPLELAKVLIESGQEESARSVLRQMLRDFPDNRDAQALLDRLLGNASALRSPPAVGPALGDSIAVALLGV